MHIMHTEEVCILPEVTGLEQSLIQKIIIKVEEKYLGDIQNRTTKSVNYNVEDILTHIQDKYGQLMPH